MLDRLHGAMALAKRRGTKAALLFLDLDRSSRSMIRLGMAQVTQYWGWSLSTLNQFCETRIPSVATAATSFGPADRGDAHHRCGFGDDEDAADHR